MISDSPLMQVKMTMPAFRARVMVKYGKVKGQTMKVLFSKACSNIRLADKERMIFDIGGDRYVDINGNAVPPEECFKPVYCDDYYGCSDNPWNQEWIEYEGLEEKLVSESVIEPVEEIDDIFGKYGFKNQAGEFVIEPQYAYAREFTCGLAAVNLNRTWYKTEDGRRFYENHYGYINDKGQTVIPFAYNGAWPFNKYGVAVVETVSDVALIDTEGRVVPGTENLSFDSYYDYEDRYLEFYYKSDLTDDDFEEILVGIYDTKENRVILEPSVSSITVYDEDEILVYEQGGEFGASDFREYYVNGKGEKKYPWLNDKGFAIIKRPNKSLVTVVAVSKYTELSGDPSSYFLIGGKKNERVFMYGLYSPKGFFLLPMEYESIKEVSDNIFVCLKDGVYTVIKLDEADYK